MDGLEDAVMVWLGAWYGAAWWPVLICGAGLYTLWRETAQKVKDLDVAAPSGDL